MDARAVIAGLLSKTKVIIIAGINLRDTVGRQGNRAGRKIIITAGGNSSRHRGRVRSYATTAIRRGSRRQAGGKLRDDSARQTSGGRRVTVILTKIQI